MCRCKKDCFVKQKALRRGYEQETIRVLYQNARNHATDEETVNLQLLTCPSNQHQTTGPPPQLPNLPPPRFHTSENQPACSTTNKPFVNNHCTNNIPGCKCTLDGAYVKHCMLFEAM